MEDHNDDHLQNGTLGSGAQGRAGRGSSVFARGASGDGSVFQSAEKVGVNSIWGKIECLSLRKPKCQQHRLPRRRDRLDGRGIPGGDISAVGRLRVLMSPQFPWVRPNLIRSKGFSVETLG